MATLGQTRVKAEFNPDKNGTVDLIKNKSAELIDMLDKMKQEHKSSEQHRLCSIAQTEIETACMYAVKACFTD